MGFLNLSFVLFLLAITHTVYSQVINDPSLLEGRWNMTITENNKEYTSWLEVRKSGFKTLVGRVMIFTGSSRPISEIHFDSGRFTFTIPPQWERREDNIQFEGVLYKDSISGSIVNREGKKMRWRGTRTPLLERLSKPVWGDSISLFNGKSLDGWETKSEDWVAINGILSCRAPKANIKTTARFIDFKLHFEFKIPERGNSGVYLRGRYEVQIFDSKGLELNEFQLGSIYGLLPPNQDAARESGEWQSMEIELVGRRVSVIVNDIPVIIDQVIPGITGGAIDSNETEPGPIVLQGDHSSIEFRNIILIPAN